MKKKTKAKYSPNKSEDNVFTMVKHGIKSEQFPLAVGIFLFLFSVYSFVCFVSYYYTWFTDYDLVKNITASDLFFGEISIHNWGGNVGAALSYTLITNTFGIGAFGLLFILVLISLRLFKVRIEMFSKWIVSIFVIMLWISCVMGFVVVCFDVDRMQDFAGIVGVGINEIFFSLIGKIGAGILLLAFTITIPMLLFGVKYLWVRNAVKDIAKPKSKMDIPKAEKDEIADLSKPSKEGIKEAEIPENKGGNSNIVAEKLEITADNPNVTADNHNKSTEENNKAIFNAAQASIHNDNLQKSRTKSDTDDIKFTVNRTSGDIEQTEVENLEEETPIEQDNKQEIERHTVEEPFNPLAELSYFHFPTTELLIDYDKNNTIVSDRELMENKQKIVSTLLNYGIEISSIAATTGPTVTLYEIIPAPGVRISKIKSLEDDIALSLSALGIRIIAPIPGKGTIGIEVPNYKPQVVSMKSMLESEQFLNNKYELPIAIGKRIDNTPYVTDLTKMPHLLVAGATGQGKSVGLNAIISSLLYKKHPAEIKFVFVDPKKVELSLYAKLEKHYLAKIPGEGSAVLTEVKDVMHTLQSLCALMDTRYELLKDAGCKKITEYNRKFCARKLNPERGHVYMPYIVVVIDEFADLIMTAGKQIENPICRLAQLARAVGIHLIIATQRPSVKIITGAIKANFPARMAFKVSALVDSRTILDTKGAEQLIGRGDMLISNGGGLIRLQCALIDTDEIEKVVDFISQQQGFPECFILPEPPEDDSDESVVKKELEGKLDSRFEEAARLIVMTQQGSTSMLQRKLELGYNRAGRLMDQMESTGIVGPFRGSKPRDVLVSSDAELDMILARVLSREQ